MKHREDGPAYIYTTEVKINDFIAWYKEGKRHRLDGPAIEFIYFSHSWRNYYNKIREGWEQWWYKGNLIDASSQQEFERLIKLTPFF